MELFARRRHSATPSRRRLALPQSRVCAALQPTNSAMGAPAPDPLLPFVSSASTAALQRRTWRPDEFTVSATFLPLTLPR